MNEFVDLEMAKKQSKEVECLTKVRDDGLRSRWTYSYSIRV